MVRGRIYHQIFIIFILVLGIMPAYKSEDFSTPIQYFLLPFLLFGVIFGTVKVPRILFKFMLLWVLIIIEVIISGFFGPAYKLNQYIFPRDSIQYIARALYFIFFFLYFYRSTKISGNHFLLYFLSTLSLGMLVGVFQWLPWRFAETVAEAYTYNRIHVDSSLIEIAIKRIPGVSGNATSNGGIAAFSFILASSCFLFQNKFNPLTIVLMLLAIFNTIASQARAGYLTILFSIFSLYFTWMYLNKRYIKPSLYLIIGIGCSIFLFSYLYNQNNPIIIQAIYRWTALGEQIQDGGNRIGQVPRALSQLNDSYDYIFGISRFIQQRIGDLYIEIEPVNIFVMYGSLGFVLQYSLVVFILFYLAKHLKYYPLLSDTSTMIAASFISLLSYQFFSMAYFFFREIYIGLFPWILIGATMGMIEKQKRIPHHSLL